MIENLEYILTSSHYLKTNLPGSRKCGSSVLDVMEKSPDGKCRAEAFSLLSFPSLSHLRTVILTTTKILPKCMKVLTTGNFCTAAVLVDMITHYDSKSHIQLFK